MTTQASPGTTGLRRASDRYIAIGLVAVAMFMWIVVVRLAIDGDWPASTIYLVPTLIVSYAAGATTRQMFRRWDRRAPSPRTDRDPAHGA